MLRIGPFIAAEWNFGSDSFPSTVLVRLYMFVVISFLWCNYNEHFSSVCVGFRGVPVWLHYIPGTVFQTNNEPFKVTVACEFCNVLW